MWCFVYCFDVYRLIPLSRMPAFVVVYVKTKKKYRTVPWHVTLQQVLTTILVNFGMVEHRTSIRAIS